ncbi:DUF2177 family protein [Arthrobacter sp. CAN_C5]|uniref:DUF2177 family protein n=1 Tax=Arthrobacter sp. CAN_C5 TaxID=2760706 RepID=UPI001AE6D17B|nr:DUF2177 family protein [Arthrobacter sp. CAN_C5]MBP2217207.1 putative membrane protein [Arthrobacter sp. CAN_C5]
MIFLQFLVAAATFLLLDAVWLKSMSKFYRGQLGDQLADKPNFLYAAAFYLIYIAGIVLFAVQPALAAGSWLAALGYGGALGLFAYATYDLTNASTLKRWPALLIVVDLAWGTALTALITLATYLVFA